MKTELLMKQALKVTFGAIISLGMIAPLQAHMHNVDHILNRSAVWVAGTYTKASDNGVSVGDVLTSTTNDNPFITYDGHRATFLEPDYEWNYALGARFHLPDSHSHLFVTYDHFRNDASRADANLVNDGQPRFFANDTSASAYLAQSADEFRLGIDRGLHFGNHFCVSLSAFFEYDRIVQDIHQANTEFGQLPTVTAAGNVLGSSTRDTENKLRGYGPGVGALGRVYPFAHAKHWSVFAGIMNTLLFAKEDFSDFWAFSNDSVLDIEPEQSKSVVGKIDVNFGIEHSFRHHHGYYWDVAAGLRYLNIFNAFKNGNTMWQPNGGGGDGLAYYAGPAQDWGRWGPYIQFSVAGAHS